MALWFLPGWLYRFTLKSTAWFWWPLAYLGGPPLHANDPVLFRNLMFRTLWGWTSLFMAGVTILAWVLPALPWRAVIHHRQVFLSPIGYLWVVNWSEQQYNQLLGLVMALLTLAIALRINYVGVRYDRADRIGNDALKAQAVRSFEWVEVWARLRSLLQIPFWLLVGGYMVLFANAWSCQVTPPVWLTSAAQMLYGRRAPPACEGDRSALQALFFREGDD